MTDHAVHKSESGLAYARSGQGRPVVLLHGVPGSSRAWRAVAVDLSAAHDVIVPDLLGFGASARTTDLDRLHVVGQARALAALFDELDIRGGVVIGHDLGGPIALTLLNTRPDLVAALGLLATNTFADTPVPFPLSTVTWPVLGSAAARLVFSRPSLQVVLRQGVGDRSLRLDPSVYIGDRSQHRTVALVFRETLARLRDVFAPVEAMLAEVEVPRFVGWGDRDPFFPLAQGKRTAAALRTPLKVYEGAGHFLPEERPHEVAADIAALALGAGR